MYLAFVGGNFRQASAVKSSAEKAERNPKRPQSIL